MLSGVRGAEGAAGTDATEAGAAAGPGRAGAAVASAAVLAAVAAFALVHQMPAVLDRGVPSSADDLATDGESRYAAIRPLLADVPLAGFITNERPEREHDVREYYLAQYALVPTVLVRGADHPIVVGSLFPDLPPADSSSLAGLELVAAGPDGVVLFRRRER